MPKFYRLDRSKNDPTYWSSNEFPVYTAHVVYLSTRNGFDEKKLVD